MSEDPRPDLIESLSRGFERLGGWAFDHRWWVLGLAAAVLGGATWLATTIRFDNSMESYFDTNDPVYVAYNRFREDFGSDEIAFILYEAPDAEHSVFDVAVMQKIARLTKELEGVPFVSEVTSLANVEYMEGVPGGLEIYELLEEFPPDQAGMLAVREKALAKPLYVGGIVSADGRTAAILVDMQLSAVDPVEELMLDPEGGEGLANLYPQVSYHAIEALLAKPEYAGIVFHHVGDVPLNSIYNEIVTVDLEQLSLLSFGAIGLLLFFFFRRPIGVIGPLVVVATSIMVSLGFVALVGWKLDLMVIMLPTLLIAVGVADAVHIIAEFRAYHAEHGDRREAAQRTLYLVGTPCLLTSLTTAAGFASMAVSPIESVSHFAVYSAVGVLAAFFLTITLLFVFLSFGRRRLSGEATPKEILQAKGGRLFQAALVGTARLVIGHRYAIIAAFAVLFAIAGVGLTRLRVDSNFMSEFSPEEPIRVATEYVDEQMGGSYSLTYVFDSGEPEGVKDPAFLRAIDELQERAGTHELVRKTYSIGDLLKDVNKSFHDEDPEHYTLPESRELAAQYLLLYEMSGGEELGDYVTGDRARASLELRMKIAESSRIGRVANDLDAWIAARPDEPWKATATGMGALWIQLQDYITSSQIQGFLLAFGVVALLLCLLFRSFKTGMIAMVPNLTPVILILGGMGWAGIPLDYIRLMIATVALGIAVDDTIHHVTRMHIEFRRTGSYALALENSMRDVGRALVITSLVLVAGFLTFLGSRLDTYAIFGPLLAGTITAALVADLLLMPALVLVLEPFGPERMALEDSAAAATEAQAARS